MKSPFAIQVQDVSKRFRIGLSANAERKPFTDLVSKKAKIADADIRLSALDAPEESHLLSENNEPFIWALKDVSFTIQQGEVVGIIGANGAGKSTMLKILTRITEPTQGSIDLYGRVGSLLEVGTGFHKELTGRENVYLNGAILGMKRAEIARNFDAIVAFAELEPFIDTPVKFYSSGMSVRLAFSIAAHMEPDILLVDEVLAVGDASFQKKCINKMEDVGKAGRTVIFVSHHMPSILRLCERVILLDKGRLINDGPSSRIIGEYLNASLSTSGLRRWNDLAEAPGDEVVRLRQVRVKTRDERTLNSIDVRQPVGIEMEYEILQPGKVLNPHFFVYNDEGLRIFTSSDSDLQWQTVAREAGCYVSTGWIPGNFLAEGTLVVGASIRSDNPQRTHFSEHDVVAFQVTEKPGPDLARVDYPGRFPGVVRPYLNWSTHFTPRNGNHSE